VSGWERAGEFLLKTIGEVYIQLLSHSVTHGRHIWLDEHAEQSGDVSGDSHHGGGPAPILLALTLG